MHPRQKPLNYKAKLTPINREINSNTVIVGDYNTPLSSMDKSSRHKVNKETQALSDTLDQTDLIDIHRVLHQKSAKHTLFKCMWNILRTDHMLGDKTSLSKFKKTESIIFSDYNAIRLEINYKVKTVRKKKTTPNMESKQ